MKIQVQKPVGILAVAALLCIPDLRCEALAAQHPTADLNHIVIYGQSLSCGYQSVPPVSLENYGGNLMLGDQVWWNLDNSGAEEFTPLVSSVANFYRMTYEQTLTSPAKTKVCCEVPVTGFVNALKYLMDRSEPGFAGHRFLATSCGESGQSIEKLSKHCQNPDAGFYHVFLSALKAARKTASEHALSLVCPVILWMQGESNYQANANQGLTPGTRATSDKDTYKTLMRTLVADMTHDVCALYRQTEKPFFITYQAGVQYTKGKKVPVGMAQLELSNEEESICCAGPVYQMTDRGGHLDPNGYRWFGELMAKVYYKTIVRGENWRPMQPVKITRGSDYIIIDYHVPVPPVVLDTRTLAESSQYGFTLFSNGTRLLIRSVEVISDCQLRINAGQPLNGDLEIAYADELHLGHGNVRDSDPFEGFSTYLELSDLHKPDREPLGEDGLPIYGKKYPLYNFSLAFYYKLHAGESQLNILPASSAVKTDRQADKITFWLNGRTLQVRSVCTESFRIFGLNGDNLRTGKLAAGNNELDFSEFLPGFYLLSVGESTFRFILP